MIYWVKMKMKTKQYFYLHETKLQGICGINQKRNYRKMSLIWHNACFNCGCGWCWGKIALTGFKTSPHRLSWTMFEEFVQPHPLCLSTAQSPFLIPLSVSTCFFKQGLTSVLFQSGHVKARLESGLWKHYPNVAQFRSSKWSAFK